MEQLRASIGIKELIANSNFKRQMHGGAILRKFAVLSLALVVSACGRGLPPAPVLFGKDAVEPAPVQTARLPPAPEKIQKPSVPAGPVGRIVIFRRGDTLYSISRRHGVSLRALIDINRLRPPFTLSPGRRLILPAPRTHVVAKGETVYGIARKYRVPMSALVRVNAIAPPYHVSAGRRLRLPGGAPRKVRLAAKSPGVRLAPPPRPPSPARVSGPVGKPPPRTGNGFQWPLRGRILIAFGPRGGGLHNDGINILAPAGTSVRSAENGIVAYAGNELQGFGNLLLIKHAGGWMTAYAHVGKLLVRRGQRVRRGQTVAKVGRTGNVSKPQLHFEIRRGDQPVNPMKYLARV